ncbi:MAG: hypothetical protein MUE85_09395 [Microscillaceae bacterium]|nr:hypothetical protein [Microscillaceae bacterium]
MVQIKLEVAYEQLDQTLKLLNESGLDLKIYVEDADDQNLKPMTATDFYKRINASNLAQKEKRVFTQKAVEEEVKQW